jgi:hypothetical protein
MKTWTAKMKDHDISITHERLMQFRSFYISEDSDLSARMSELLWFDIYVLDQEFGVGPHEILSSINNLEAGEPHSGIKPATAFKNPPLKGLWHKHYFSAHFLATNILLALGKKGLEKLVEEVMDPKKSSIVTHEMIEELARRVTREPVENRNSLGRLTGEWIIFARHDGKNYYLCLNTHDAGDQFVYDRIMQYCVRDFPGLPDWISAAASSSQA